MKWKLKNSGLLIFFLSFICSHFPQTIANIKNSVQNAFNYLNLLSLIVENNGTFQEYDWEKYPPLSKYPDLQVKDLPGYAHNLPENEIFSPHKIGRLIERAIDGLYTNIGLERRLSENDDKYKAFYTKYIKEPKYLMEVWRTDGEFSRQFIQGVHPMMIKVCSSISNVPVEMHKLKGQGRNIQQLIVEKRLFMADYKLLEGLPPHLNFTFYAPIVLFFNKQFTYHSNAGRHRNAVRCRNTGRRRNAGRNISIRQRLMILGIQLTRHKDRRNVIYTPDSPPNKYLLAKLFVANADVQIHQFISHLGLTHLYMDPFVIAHNNHLKKYNHSLSLLLEPHFKETISINFLARKTLIAPVNPSIDPILSIGVQSGFKIIHKVLTESNFFDHSFPNNLQQRGFTEDERDGLNDFYYRSDGFQLWNAIHNYVESFVHRTYKSNADVENDYALQMFCKSVSDINKGSIRGFPSPFMSREVLIKALTTIIFTASAQHAAVNFPQEPYDLYIPNRPQVLMEYMPDNATHDIPYSYITKSLSGKVITLAQINLAHLLTLPTENTLLKLNALEKVYPDIHMNFHNELKTLSQKIKKRNARLVKEGKSPYPYLDPDYVPVSIDI